MKEGWKRAWMTMVAMGVAAGGIGTTSTPGWGQTPPRPDPTRYTAQWIDGTRLSGERLAPWHETVALPKLADRDLFDPARPVRWIVDNSLPPAPEPEAFVELIGGDRLPGQVTGFDDGTKRPDWRVPPYLTVVPAFSVDWPEGPARPSVRVSLPWLRRIAWHRLRSRYQPRTVVLADGREMTYRAVRFSAGGVQLLREEGIREFALSELAELHFPASDGWSAYFDQLAAVSPAPKVRLTRWETSTGLRVTGTTERFQARAHGPADQPTSWYHLIQPAWALDPLWIPHETIRVRAYFQPHEVPLSQIDPAAARGESDLGGIWPWQADRNVETGMLESGGVIWPWGFGVHGASQLEFLLPPSARAFQTALGLDHLAGRGGCVKVKVWLGSTDTKPLYASEWIIGSGTVHDTGPLRLGSTSAPGAGTTGSQPQRLILHVDPAHTGRPPDADPLDIRDMFDWLIPLVELEPEAVARKMLQRTSHHIAAWQGWKVLCDGPEGLRLANYYDQTDPHELGYRLVTAVGRGPLRLIGKLAPQPYNDQLVLYVSRPPHAPPSRLEVLADGLSVAQFDIPVRGSGRSNPLVVSLDAYHFRDVTVELIQRGQDDQSWVEWRAIALVNRTAIR